jgi:hypothetical protein
MACSEPRFEKKGEGHRVTIAPRDCESDDPKTKTRHYAGCLRIRVLDFQDR